MDDLLPPGAFVPDVELAQMVVAPPAPGAGSWAGAPSACHEDGRYYLAYRMRRPTPHLRGYSVVVAASDDGVNFETMCELTKDDFGCESLERPALVRLPGGQWRLYVSCATPGTYHWRVDSVTARHPGEFDAARRITVLPGDDRWAMKDPVVLLHGDEWLLWICCHPLEDSSATDRMRTRFAVSTDGLDWDLQLGDLTGRTGCWDERGARVAHVWRAGDRWAAYYDGRPTKADNGEEHTGLAVGDAPGALGATGDSAFSSSPWGTGSLRYVSRVSAGGAPATATAWADGTRERLYYEACLPDGSHGLFTQAFELQRGH